MAGDRPDGGGLQRERTRLAWRRTALSFAAVGALLLRDGLRSGPLTEVPGVIVLIFAVIVYLLGAARSRPAGGPDRSAGAAVPARTLAALAIAAAALSLLVVLAR